MIGSDTLSLTRFFQSLTASCDNEILFDLSSIFSQSENINIAEKGHSQKYLHLYHINFALVSSGRRHKPVILEILPRSVWDYKAFQSIMERYDLRECIIIADRGIASYHVPKKKGIYLIVAVRRNSSIVDFNMKLDRRFIFRNMGINAGMKGLCVEITYMYEDTSLRSEE